MQHQNTIGWFSLLTRRASIYWSHAQQEYQQRMKIDRPTLRWTSAVLRQLFHIAWDMWLHRNNIKNETTTAAKQRKMDSLDEEINSIVVPAWTELMAKTEASCYCLLLDSNAWAWNRNGVGSILLIVYVLPTPNAFSSQRSQKIWSQIGFQSKHSDTTIHHGRSLPTKR